MPINSFLPQATLVQQAAGLLPGIGIEADGDLAQAIDFGAFAVGASD